MRRCMRRIVWGAMAPAVVALAMSEGIAQEAGSRRPVELPPDAEAVFRAQMLTHIVSLDGIVAALGKGDYGTAADIAAAGMGVARGEGDDLSGAKAGGEPGPGLGLGRFLPAEFLAIGQRFHGAANDFAAAARAMPAEPSPAEQQALMAALGKVTAECRTCHDSFRLK